MWFLTEDVHEKMHLILEQGFEFSAEQMEAFTLADRTSGNRILAIQDGVATINIRGIMTPQPDFMAELFMGGNTTFPEILAAINQAEGDPKVTSTDFVINSPGGNVQGMFDVMNAIAATKKPNRALIDGMAASAAFGIAAMTDDVIALTPTTILGSVGVVTSRSIDDGTVDITSTNAPNKRPDAATKEGRAVIRAELDQIEKPFIELIAQGRGTTTGAVKADFGRGGILIAENALAQGMIDSIISGPSRDNKAPVRKNSATSHAENDNKTEPSMDLTFADLKAKFPALFDQAKAVGAAEAKDQIQAHLVMGKMGGTAGMELALKAIENDTEMSATLTAQYQSAGFNASQSDDRLDDDKDASTKTPKKAPVLDQETSDHEAFLAQADGLPEDEYDLA